MSVLDAHADYRTSIQALARKHVRPAAATIDRAQAIPPATIDALVAEGLFASGFPTRFGGTVERGRQAVDAWIRHGLLHEALGYESASVQGLLNVHHMAGTAIVRGASSEQKQRWLPRLSSGELLAAFAITEPNVGSDAAAVETWAKSDGKRFVISGCKQWITCGQIAHLFVVLTGSDQGPCAFMVPRATDGLRIEPIHDMLGCRGYQLARIHFEDCSIPDDHLLGSPGLGLNYVAAAGLDAGRYNLAWGCVGLAQACLDASLVHTSSRHGFGGPLSDLQLVQRMISRMMTDIHAARLMCQSAGELRGRLSPDAVKEAAMAKYFASTMVNRVAYDTVQLHGARGCGPDQPIERWFRDARIMEIIEGSTQVLETIIARYGYRQPS
ncbi:acyl-CoA dehydrogenase family protein [Sorangium sp. So ce375]|uniref:acyl-CoA dehydrogenase family protein n=1 Tax=Sorangium sp. So ce375 TaxID=3133306 RepID=UPI003F5B98AF